MHKNFIGKSRSLFEVERRHDHCRVTQRRVVNVFNTAFRTHIHDPFTLGNSGAITEYR